MAKLDAWFSFVVLLRYSLLEMPVSGQTVTHNLNVQTSNACILKLKMTE